MMKLLSEQFLEQMGWYIDKPIFQRAWTHPDASIWISRSYTNPDVWHVFAEVYDLGTMRTEDQLRKLHEALEIGVTDGS